MIKQLKEDKEYFPYPHKFHTTHSIADLVEEYKSMKIDDGQFLDVEVSVAGRVLS